MKSFLLVMCILYRGSLIFFFTLPMSLYPYIPNSAEILFHFITFRTFRSTQILQLLASEQLNCFSKYPPPTIIRDQISPRQK